MALSLLPPVHMPHTNERDVVCIEHELHDKGITFLKIMQQYHGEKLSTLKCKVVSFFLVAATIPIFLSCTCTENLCDFVNVRYLM